MRLCAAGATVTGPAHEQEGVPNQDAMSVHSVNQGWCIAVSDGLGSRRLSHLGSSKAVQLVRQHVRRRGSLSPLGLGLAVRKDWLENFGDDYRDYETTCLWAHVDAFGKGRVAQAGDGLALVKSRGKFQRVSMQRQDFGNQTSTLAQADENLWELCEFDLVSPGDGVLIMTDGISDDLIPEQLEPFFDAICQRLARTNKRRMRTWLTGELHDWSTPLHGDDKSIAAIFRLG